MVKTGGRAGQEGSIETELKMKQQRYETVIWVFAAPQR